MTSVPRQLRWMALHVTAADLTGDQQPVSVEQVAAALKELSVFDCLRMVGRLSTTLLLESATSPKTQTALIDAVAGPAPQLHERLTSLLKGGQIPFFQQQLYFLARLVLLNAAERDPNDFAAGVEPFLYALFGVTDTFDSDLGDTADSDELLSWALRQCWINHNEERLTQWAFYFEVFHEIWPKLKRAPDADEAFLRYTKLSIQEYLSLGFAYTAGFGGKTADGVYRSEVIPEKFFATATVPEEKWKAFLDVSSRPVSRMRAALADEEAKFGRETAGALPIEQTPIVEGPAHHLYVANHAALERRATHGIFHILSEGAADEGLERETYTSPFGAAFQKWTEGCFLRMETGGEARFFNDLAYGSKKEPRDTPDVVMRYERQLVAVEVVAGALRVRTWTHGDVDSFTADLEKLVYKKAKQLTQRVADMKDGHCEKIGLDLEGIQTVWPVIVTAAPFPIRPEIMSRIRRELKERSLLQTTRGLRLGPISIASAEEVAAAEAYCEATGNSFLQLLTSWKSHPRTGDYYLSNFIYECGPVERAAQHHEETFASATRSMFKEIFGKEPDPDRLGRPT